MKNITETRLNFEFSLASEGRRDAAFLNELWENEKPSVGLVAVGGFSLKYNGETVDLMGLNNTLMGHSKGDRRGIKNHAAFNKDVFYQLNPDIVLPKIIDDEKKGRIHYSDLMEESNFTNKAMKNILNDTSFIARYTPVILKKNDQQLFSFISKSFQSKLAKDTGLVLTKLGL
jgi:hypothetical protein